MNDDDGNDGDDDNGDIGDSDDKFRSGATHFNARTEI